MVRKVRSKNFEGELALKKILKKITNGYTRQLIRSMIDNKYTVDELESRLKAYKKAYWYARTTTEKLDIQSTIKAIEQLMGWAKKQESDLIMRYNQKHKIPEDYERDGINIPFDDTITKCENCGSENLERDEIHAETVCRDCGVVSEIS